MGSLCSVPGKSKADLKDSQNVQKQTTNFMQPLTEIKSQSEYDWSKTPDSEHSDEESYEEEDIEIFDFSAEYGLKEGWDAPGNQLTSTWWFFTEDWPPKNHDYSPDFQRLSIRKVELEEWYNHRETDSQDRRKVFEIPLHRGLFQDSKGRFYDLKPRKDCDIYQALLTKSLPELLRSYLEAIKKELENLQAKLQQTREIQIVTNLSAPRLNQWWYCCPNWPPENFDPEQKLNGLRLRVVSLNDWEIEPLKTQDNYVKAFEVPLHPKFFQNGFMNQYNCRPAKDDRNGSEEDPDSRNFYELLDLYATAMTSHLKEFEISHAQLLSESAHLIVKSD